MVGGSPNSRDENISLPTLTKKLCYKPPPASWATNLNIQSDHRTFIICIFCGIMSYVWCSLSYVISGWILSISNTEENLLLLCMIIRCRWWLHVGCSAFPSPNTAKLGGVYCYGLNPISSYAIISILWDTLGNNINVHFQPFLINSTAIIYENCAFENNILEKIHD